MDLLHKYFLRSGIAWWIHSLPDHPDGEIVRCNDCSISLCRTVQTENKKTECSPTTANHTERQKHYNYISTGSHNRIMRHHPSTKWVQVRKKEESHLNHLSQFPHLNPHLVRRCRGSSTFKSWIFESAAWGLKPECFPTFVRDMDSSFGSSQTFYYFH